MNNNKASYLKALKKAKKLGVSSKVFKRYYESFDNNEEEALEFCKLPPEVRQAEIRKRSLIKKYGVPYRPRSEEELAKFSKSMKSRSLEDKEKTENKKRSTKIEHFGDPTFNNTKKAKETNLERYGDETYNNRDQFKKTKLEKYGNENYVNSEKAKETWANKTNEELLEKKIKSKKTLFEKYGNENYYNVDKMKSTNLKKYGVEYSFQNEEVKEKSSKTKEERYGNKNYNNSEKSKETWASKSIDELNKILEKTKQTKIERYGNANYVNVEKAKETKLEKYNNPNYVNSEKAKETWANKTDEELKDITEKRAKTCIERYGVENPRCSNVIKEKIKSTFVERYGVAHPLSYKYCYDNESFDSTWELAFWIYHKDHNSNITRSNKCFKYFHNNKEHEYYPDFEIDNKFYEIKGNQFFKEDGTMQNPFDHTLDDLFEAKHQCMINNNVVILKGTDLAKELSYVEEKYTLDFLKLFKKDLPFPYPNENLFSETDYALIKHFHKSIYDAKRENCISPKDAWENKNLIKKCALNRLRYIGKCRPSDILSGFNVTKIAPKVSVFKPELAADLIKEFLPDCKKIFDPFSGFSGRMLGAAKLNIEYIGQDINEEHVRESNEIIKYKNLKNCSVKVQDIFADNNKVIDGCLFTCSPYNNKEIWNNNDKNLSCDEWIDICLEKYKCDKYLFVVDNTEKYKNNIVKIITNKSHFGKNDEYVILL